MFDGAISKEFMAVLTAAMSDAVNHGYDSQSRMDMWLARLRAAADKSLVSDHDLDEAIFRYLNSIYTRQVDQGAIIFRHPGVDRFTIQRIKPHLRDELSRRIASSAKLIRLHRKEAIEKTLQRFSGWMTSIPPGGTKAVDRRKEKTNIRRSIAQLKFEERRVAIDQGHKLISNISEIVATDEGALAAIWRSNWRQPGYNYRADHKERDGRVYAVKGNWALKAGLMKIGPDGYLDDITRPAEEPFCRCYAIWVYSLDSLPDKMLTEKGRRELAKVA